MEGLNDFLKIETGDGSGYGSGYGNGSGYGDGYGDGRGDSYGDGRGYGRGYGDGRGYGEGHSGNLKAVNGDQIYIIDGVQTILKSIHSNLAKGFILQNDLITEPCYVVKSNNLFAHGETAKEAMEALQDKIFANMDSDEVIENFINTFELGKKYPVKEFFNWHHRLTGSCRQGRLNFAYDNNIDLENDEMTVDEFIKLTINAHGGRIIKELKEYIEELKFNY